MCPSCLEKRAIKEKCALTLPCVTSLAWEGTNPYKTDTKHYKTIQTVLFAVRNHRFQTSHLQPQPAQPPQHAKTCENMRQHATTRVIYVVLWNCVFSSLGVVLKSMKRAVLSCALLLEAKETSHSKSRPGLHPSNPKLENLDVCLGPRHVVDMIDVCLDCTYPYLLERLNLVLAHFLDKCLASTNEGARRASSSLVKTWVDFASESASPIRAYHVNSFLVIKFLAIPRTLLHDSASKLWPPRDYWRQKCEALKFSKCWTIGACFKHLQTTCLFHPFPIFAHIQIHSESCRLYSLVAPEPVWVCCSSITQYDSMTQCETYETIVIACLDAAKEHLLTTAVANYLDPSKFACPMSRSAAWDRCTEKCSEHAADCKQEVVNKADMKCCTSYANLGD